MIVRAGHFLFRWRNALFPCAVALAFVPSPVLFDDPLIAAGLAVVPAVVGEALRVAVIGLEYIIRGGRMGNVYAEELVTGGVFAHCRNPLYVGNVLIVIGLAIASNAWVGLLAAPVVAFVAYYCMTRAEEDYLRKRFGERYDAYCETTPRFAVRLRGFATTLRRGTFHWRRVLVKEYGTPVGWSFAIVLLAIGNLARGGNFAAESRTIAWLGGYLCIAAAFWIAARFAKKKHFLVGD